MSASRAEREKRELLELIRDNYRILNGGFSARLTREDKIRTWKEIFDQCKARGHAWTESKTEMFLRQTKWPIIKRRVIAKVAELRKRTDPGRMRLTDLDNFVLDFIGREPHPDAIVLNVSESYTPEEAKDQFANNSLHRCGEEQANEVCDEGRDSDSRMWTVDAVGPVARDRPPSGFQPMEPRYYVNNVPSPIASISRDSTSSVSTPYVRRSDAPPQTIQEELQMLQKIMITRAIYQSELEIYEMENRLGIPHLL